MKKKMIIAAVFVATIAITASVVFASDSCGCDRRHRHSNDCCPKVEVDADNNVNVSTDVRTRANTGDNYVHAGYFIFGAPSIETGAADALGDARTTVRGADVSVDMPYRGAVDVDADNNVNVTSNVTTTANSGRNRICGKGEIDTGTAMSTSYSTTSVEGATVDIY